MVKGKVKLKLNLSKNLPMKKYMLNILLTPTEPILKKVLINSILILANPGRILYKHFCY